MKKKILIIEGDEETAKLERGYLEANGFYANVVHSGHEGVHAALKYDYSLVILALMLPDIDGFQVCREIRSAKNIPILVVSSKRDDIDKTNAFRLGIDDYVVKPFSPSELVARVKGHISRYEVLVNKAAPPQDMLTFGKLVIDKNARRISADGNEITLTNKEFDLLCFLAMNPDTVFTKAELFKTIWGYEAMGGTSTVTVHINRIREKIHELCGEAEYIETVWGAGYRFKTD